MNFSFRSLDMTNGKQSGTEDIRHRRRRNFAQRTFLARRMERHQRDPGRAAELGNIDAATISGLTDQGRARELNRARA